MSIEQSFPHLRSTGYRVTSPSTPYYNCIAWAADEDNRWWEPDPFGLYYWPESSPRQRTLEAYMQAFISLGYTPCNTDELEQGFEKIALYVDPQSIPTHAAKQLSNGRWTSKLGQLEDIEHTLEGLKNSIYGSVAQVLRRPAAGS